MMTRQKLLSVLIIFTGITSVYCQELFNEKNAFVNMLKLSANDVNLYLDEFLFRFENSSYRSFTEDEFETRRIKEDLFNTVSETNNENIYYIEYESDFGEYNFDENKFGFQPFDETSIIKVVDYLFAPRFKTNTQIFLKFLNGDEISGLPMGYDKASFLVKMRKNTKTGKVDRRIYLKVYFILDPSIEFSETNSTRSSVNMFGNITTIEAYDNSNYTNAPLTTVVSKYNILRESEKKLSEKMEEEKE